MDENYWLRRRISRRTTVRGAALTGLGAGALALVGCGDDDSTAKTSTAAATSGASSPSSGGTAAASATAATAAADQPKAGGTFRFPLAGLSSADPPTLDPFENLTFLAQVPATVHYSRLLRSSTGPNIAAEDFTKLEGDIAQKWEQPDDKTYVFTMKPNVKFHDKPPMNGRVATAGDFAKTYQAFLKSQNSAGWQTVVDKVEAPDDKTIRVTMKAPFAPFLVTHASSAEGCWFIPTEIIDSGQVKKDPVGTGPWVFRQWETGVALRWDRHPGYHDAPLPWADKIEASLNKDPQRIIAALVAGSFDLSLLSPLVYTDAHGKLDPKGKEYFASSPVATGFFFNFDVKPWGDKRVRQALSMSLDRDAYIKAQDPTGKTPWQSHLAASLAPYYLDPKDDAKFGPNSKYFKRNITDAKALLSAAGFPDGISFKLHANVDAYGAAYQQQWEVLAATMKDAGFKAELDYQPYASYVQSTYLGKFTDGAAVGPLIGSPRDPDNIFFTTYASVAARHNWGGTPIPEQADLDAHFAKQRTLLKLEERVAEINDIQKSMAESMMMVPTYNLGGYGYAQPWVKNYNDKIGYAPIPESIAKAYFTDDRIKKG